MSTRPKDEAVDIIYQDNTMDKVIWSEGMFLRPQHFQHQERYFETQAISRMQHLVPYYWGLKRLEIDSSLLSIGKLAITAAEGVFSDGSLFRVHQSVLPPLIIQLDESHVDQKILLAVSSSINGVVESNHTRESEGAEDKEGVEGTEYWADRRSDSDYLRYREISVDVRDSHGVNNTRTYPISTGALNLKLVPEEELDDALVAIPIASITAFSGNGEVVLDPLFSGPLIDISAFHHGRSILIDFISLANTKAEQLASNIESGAAHGASTIVDLLMLKAINSLMAELSAMVDQSPLHPYDLFKRLLSFIAEISTYSDESRLVSVHFHYRHNEPYKIIRKLIEHATVLISTAFKSAAMSLPLHRKSFGISVIGMPSPTLVENTEWVLAVKADLSSDHLRKLVGSKLKIGSIDNIENLVNLQLPGCLKEPLPVTPRQIPYHSGMNYFRVLADAEMKASIKQSNGIGLHVSGEVPGIDIAFWVIPGSIA